MRAIFLCALCAFLLPSCSNATWDDTFSGKDTRTTGGGIAPLDDSGIAEDVALPLDGGASSSCNGLATSAAPVPIVVTFPGHGTTTETVHIVVGSKSCDFAIDTDTDGVAFSSDTFACAALIAVGTPISGTATASGDSSPNDLLFEWSYGAACTIDDDYALTSVGSGK